MAVSSRLAAQKRPILLNPGPGTTSASVKQAMVVADICPRVAPFQQLLSEIQHDLLRVVNGLDHYTCIPFCGSGTAVMEACISSVPPAAATLLVIDNGVYGSRLAEIAAVYQIPVERLTYAASQPANPDEITARLEANPEIAGIAMVHHETTTGLLNPLEEMVSVARRLNRFSIVDAISSFAAIPLDLRQLPVDFLLASANKCLQGMAGLSFVIARKPALAKLAKQPQRSYYLDLYRQSMYLKEQGQMPFTPPVQVVYALKQALIEYFQEGSSARAKRYRANWSCLHDGLAQLGFRFFLAPEHQSHILLTILEPDHPRFHFATLHNHLLEQGFTIYPGKLGPVATFRLAVIGDLHQADMEAFLTALQETMQLMGITGPLYRT